MLCISVIFHTVHLMYVCKWLYSSLLFESAVKLQMLIKCFTCVSTLEKIFTYNKIYFSCINDRITKMNNWERIRNQLVESFFVRGGGYECVCVCVCVNAARLSFIYSALTIPLHQMGTNRVRGESERKKDRERERTQREREEWEVCAPYSQPWGLLCSPSDPSCSMAG